MAVDIQNVLALHAAWLSGRKDGSRADLQGANLQRADLQGANLQRANLRGADLQGANLRGANLQGANLRGANLRGANLRGANLRGADLWGADLSGVIGLLDPVEWMARLERTTDGIVAYKRVGKTEYAAPATWTIAPGSVLAEVCHPDRTLDCACGVNVGSRAWCDAHYQDAALWRVLIRWEWLSGVVVPYNTDGKFRCSRVELVEVVDERGR